MKHESCHADTDTVIAHGGIKASVCPFIHGEDLPAQSISIWKIRIAKLIDRYYFSIRHLR